MDNVLRIRARDIIWLGLFAGLAGCTVNEPPVSRVECRAGEPCGDAAADTQSEVQVGPADARVEPVPSVIEAGTVPVCPGECNPEDALVCSMSTRAALVALDGGQTASPSAESGAGVDASDALQTLDRYSDAGGRSDSPGESADLSLPADAALDGGPSGGGPRDAGGGQLGVLDAAAGGGGGGNQTVPACQLVNHSGTVVAECSVAGTGAEGAACASSRDCAPGLGCVSAAGAGQCLPYCCGGNDSCGPGRYCAPRPLRSADLLQGQSAPTIPVCAVADNCSLMLGSCTDPGGCSCPPGLACTIVRADTTACVEPGGGMEGERCPCAPGYFCSRGTDTCLKFCNTKDPSSSCGARECQPGPSGFPLGWGLCVGTEEG